MFPPLILKIKKRYAKTRIKTLLNVVSKHRNDVTCTKLKNNVFELHCGAGNMIIETDVVYIFTLHKSINKMLYRNTRYNNLAYDMKCYPSYDDIGPLITLFICNEKKT